MSRMRPREGPRIPADPRLPDLRRFVGQNNKVMHGRKLRVDTTPSRQRHMERSGVLPKWPAADAGFFSVTNEVRAEKMGVKRVVIPCRFTKSVAQATAEKAVVQESPEMAYQL